MIQNFQNFLWEFVTNPDSDDDRFIFQSAFHNINIGVKGWKNKNFLTPECYGWPKNLQISVNELFEMQNFINFDKFKTLFHIKTGKNTLAESELMKKSWKKIMRFFKYKQNLNLPNTTSWQSCLNDPSITIADVNKSLHWLSKSELCQN